MPFENAQNSYNQLKTLDGTTVGVAQKGSGNIAQTLFSFNLIEAIERNVGKIPASDKVAWLKNNIAKITYNGWHFGQSPTGYKASISLWKVATSSWISNWNSNSSSTPSKISNSINLTAVQSGEYFDSNGFVHFLAYAEPSDGTTASTINTDYVELEIELAQNAQLWNPRFPLYEVDATTEYPNILTTWDENEVMRRYPMVDSVQHVQNPYVIAEGENLLPPFTDSAWTIHANAVVREPYKLELNATAGSQISSVDIPCKPNTQYTISVITNSDRFGIFPVDASGVEGSSLGNAIGTSLTFMTPSTAVKIRVKAYSTTSGTFTFSQPMLTLGSTAKPFVPRNPSYLFAEVKLGALSDKKDILFKDGQDWKVTKWIEKDVVLDGKLAWALNTDYTGYKRIGFNNSLGFVANGVNGIITKYDGKPLKRSFTGDSDFYDSSSTYTWVQVPDTDSGWTEHYKPSAQEIQAYFNGWKANGYTTGTSVTNELTGQLASNGTYTFAQSGAYRNVVVEKSTDNSTWSPAVENTDFKIDISGTKAILTNLSASALYFRISYSYGVTVNSWASLVDGSAPTTNTLAYVSANMAPGFTPYKLSYVLATPQTIVVSDKVEGDLIVNGTTQVEVGSGFTYTEVDGKRTYTKLAGNQRYNVTSNILSIIANYDSSLKSVVDSVVTKQSDIAAQVSVNINAIVDLYARVKALEGGA